MNILFQAHSGLRYLVLLAGVVSLAYFVSGLATKRPVDKGVRILGASFTGLLDLQILLGLLVIVTGRPFTGQLIGHIVMMLLAATVTHVLLVVNRKRPTPGYVLPAIAVALALALIFGGIMAIGRGVLTHTTLAG